MQRKIAIDFGTTNSVVAAWDAASGATSLVIPNLSAISLSGAPAQPGVPSLLYVQDGQAPQVLAGYQVVAHGLDHQKDNRLFRNFKRGLLAQPAPDPRLIDGVHWSDMDAGRHFLYALLKALPYAPEEIEQLIITVPVAAFDNYVAWLNRVMQEQLLPRSTRVVDESTAAALGYSITEPGALVLVIDFGGGSLDLSLVQLPESRSQTGSFLGQILKRGPARSAARVIAKAGLSLGGSDIDQWLLAEALRRLGLAPAGLGADFPALLTACEQAKIALSSQPAAGLHFTAGEQAYHLNLQREDLEALLEAHGFYAALRQAMGRVLYTAHRQGIYKEDVRHVLLVGGVSLIPSVQETVRHYFGAPVVGASLAVAPQVGAPQVRVDKPFTAVVEGALQLVAGFGVDDYLLHSYGLRYLDPSTGQIAYDEIIPQGSRYPTPKPVELTLAAAHHGQSGVDFLLAEISTDAVAQIEVEYENGQPVFVAQPDREQQEVTLLNPAGLRVPLCPPVTPGTDRLVARFWVDDQRRFCLSVSDLQTGATLVENQVLARLGEQEARPVRQEEVSGCEPALSASQARRGWNRLSLRSLGTLLNLLPPGAISLPAAAEALRSPDFYTRYGAADLLSRRGDRESRRILADFLVNGTPPQRASVANHLYRFSWYVAEPLLRQALSDPELPVREAAVYALCRLRGPNAYRLLLDTLSSGNEALILAAAWGLNRQPDPESLPVLAAIMQANITEASVKTLETLGAVREPQALPLVIQAAGDPDLEIKYAAVLSWVELAEAGSFPAIAALIHHSQGAARLAVLRGLFHATNYTFINIAESPAADELLAAFKAAQCDRDPAVRRATAMLLAWMPHPRAAAMLEAAYRQEANLETKIEILAVAVQLMSAAAQSILENARSHPEPDLRRAAQGLARAATRAS